jgi:predicted nucleotidyltransferase
MNLSTGIAELLDALVTGIQAVLGDNLVGVYLRGSLVTGDFDPRTSDIDFLAVTERPLSEIEFASLAAMHARQLDH